MDLTGHGGGGAEDAGRGAEGGAALEVLLAVDVGADAFSLTVVASPPRTGMREAMLMMFWALSSKVGHQ